LIVTDVEIKEEVLSDTAAEDNFGEIKKLKNKIAINIPMFLLVKLKIFINFI
jgi:hypothetical protein